MRHTRVSVIALLVVVAVALTSCGFSASVLTNTHWRVAVAGSGTGYHFITETTGDYEIGLLGTWADIGGGGFTYTYDAATKTGVIEGVTDFTVDGQNLTIGGTTYKYAK